MGACRRCGNKAREGSDRCGRCIYYERRAGLSSTKTCPKCRIPKDRVTGFGIDKRGKALAWCRTCRAAKQREQYRTDPAYRARNLATAKRWALDHPDLVKDRLLRKFHITFADYLALFEAQGGCCAVCGRPESFLGADGRPIWLAVDHDHACCPTRKACCGKCIRGLLCVSCNHAAGQLGDDPDRAAALATYLRR